MGKYDWYLHLMLHKIAKYHLDHRNLDHSQVYLVCTPVQLAIIHSLRIESHSLHLLSEHNNDINKLPVLYIHRKIFIYLTINMFLKFCSIFVSVHFVYKYYKVNLPTKRIIAGASCNEAAYFSVKIFTRRLVHGKF